MTLIDADCCHLFDADDDATAADTSLRFRPDWSLLSSAFLPAVWLSAKAHARAGLIAAAVDVIGGVYALEGCVVRGRASACSCSCHALLPFDSSHGCPSQRKQTREGAVAQGSHSALRLCTLSRPDAGVCAPALLQNLIHGRLLTRL